MNLRLPKTNEDIVDLLESAIELRLKNLKWSYGLIFDSHLIEPAGQEWNTHIVYGGICSSYYKEFKEALSILSVIYEKNPSLIDNKRAEKLSLYSDMASIYE